jgi:hypothetical protein
VTACGGGGGGGHVATHSAEAQIQFGVDMAKRGLWNEALFRFEQALDAYQTALRFSPDNRELRRNYSRFVEFYQSFKPDQPGSPSGEDEPATAGDGNQGQPLPTTPLDQPTTPEEPSGAPVNPS